MPSRKRRKVGPGLTGADLEAAVLAVAAQAPGTVALQVVGDDGRVGAYPIVQRPIAARRVGRYGDLDPGQVLQQWNAALKRVPRDASRQRFAMALGVDRSTAYRWRKRFGLRFPDEQEQAA